jgi:hypothetical protein
LCGLDDKWILGPPGVLGDQLAVNSWVCTLSAASFIVRRPTQVTAAMIAD